MTIRRTNPRLQGLIGLAAAIDWFTRTGYFVAIPLNDSQPWDLVVEDSLGVVSRVQVKTTTFRSPSGNYVASLETAGGTRALPRASRSTRRGASCCSSSPTTATSTCCPAQTSPQHGR